MAAVLPWPEPFFLAVFLVFSAGAQIPANNGVGKSESLLLTVEGNVVVASATSTNWTLGRTNQVLAVGDRVRTGVRSRATIQLSNKSVVRVNELTILRIQPPPQASHVPALDLQKGGVYFFSREKPAQVEFRTPLAAGAIRGTEFTLEVADDGKTMLSLLDGNVSLSNPQGEVELRTGEQGIVDPGEPPRKTAVINAINVIQWNLYYPGVLDPDDLRLDADTRETLASSLTAYRSGDLLQALEEYPSNRPPTSAAERIYLAALLLSVGNVQESETELGRLESMSALADALREVIAAVKHQTWTRPAPATSATEWMAESYYLQSRGELEQALAAARTATEKSPLFGFAWARLAELEFSFGRNREVSEALDKALQLSPRNAQAIALKGFLVGSMNRFRDASELFSRAIAIDPALANAWLGRGLSVIRMGDADAGRLDLQVAAALEPNRSVLRSYLGKAFANAGEDRLARKELGLAERLDPGDPTPWLYSALVNQDGNRINDAVRDLERSQELNDNRSLFRSKQLLDQDRAVRSANLAGIYRDAGMTNYSVIEASRAVNSDYADYSAHAFLANSYDALRDPRQLNLRYETPWLSEMLMAHLLAPVGGGSLSQFASQQEYSRMFERDGPGIISSTDYLSNGSWHQSGSQYGTFGDFSYALDVDYLTLNGERPNNDFESLSFAGRFKFQITPADSVYLQIQYNNYEFGDVRQLYDQSNASTTLHVEETQAPNLYAGYHHEWSPGNHTLVLVGRLDDTLTQSDTNATVLTLNLDPAGQVTAVTPRAFGLNYERNLEAYSAEVQQIWQPAAQTIIAGIRYQAGSVGTDALLERNPVAFPPIYGNPPSDQQFDNNLQRFSAYAYDYWQVTDRLELIAGLSYDWLQYPLNSEVPPLSSQETSTGQISPKAGLIWTPFQDTTVRAAYTRSLGGVFFDNSVRLEPTQIAGFNQAFRSLIPESVVGLVPGAEFETWGLALDQQFKSGTYFNVTGEILNSSGQRVVGVFDFAPPSIPATPSGTTETLDFTERNLFVSVNQLIGEMFALGATYRITDAQFSDNFLQIPATVAPAAHSDVGSTLQQVFLFGRINHPSGFFGEFNSIWSHQSNSGYAQTLPGEDLWQFNAFVGYRFLKRKAEVRLGLFNITDQDYQLNPLTLYSELPRERLLAASFRFYY